MSPKGPNPVPAPGGLSLFDDLPPPVNNDGAPKPVPAPETPPLKSILKHNTTEPSPPKSILKSSSSGPTPKAEPIIEAPKPAEVPQPVPAPAAVKMPPPPHLLLQNEKPEDLEPPAPVAKIIAPKLDAAPAIEKPPVVAAPPEVTDKSSNGNAEPVPEPVPKPVPEPVAPVAPVPEPVAPAAPIAADGDAEKKDTE